MTRAIVVGASGPAMIAARVCASAGACPRWIPVGDAGLVPEAVRAAVAGELWGDPIAPARRVWTGLELLELPLDPIDVARAIGRRRFLADAGSAVLARAARSRPASLADAYRTRIGRRWYARWCAPWLAARLGASADRLAVDVMAGRPDGGRWVWPRPDAVESTSEAVWGAGGDVGEALAVDAIELDGGQVAALETEAGRELVDGLVFVDTDPGEIDGWDPDAPQMPGELVDEVIVEIESDGELQVVEIVDGPAWRVAAGFGRAWVFAGADEADPEQIGALLEGLGIPAGPVHAVHRRVVAVRSAGDQARIAARWRYWADRGVVLLGANLGTHLAPDAIERLVGAALGRGATSAWAVVEDELLQPLGVTPTAPYVG